MNDDRFDLIIVFGGALVSWLVLRARALSAVHPDIQGRSITVGRAFQRGQQFKNLLRA